MASAKQIIPGYEVYGKIGSGGMATVYKAKQLSLDRLVAIKILSKHAMRNPKFIERFYAEGRAAAKLNHPNIVSALDVGQAGDFHYFVMEYIEGETVYDMLQDEVRFEEQDAVPIMLAIAKALQHAHEAGLIHRDIKPQNMIVDKDDIPKLLDLGLAREVGEDIDDGTKKNEVVGSPYYMSPEQIRKKADIDFRTDIYSLGATFYLLVTGKVPFDGDTPQDILRGHLKERLTRAREHNPKLSKGADRVICACMAKEPGKRYKSTADLVQDLEALSMFEDPIHAAVLVGSLGEPEEEDLPQQELTDEERAERAKRRKKRRHRYVDLDSVLMLAGWGLAILFFVLWLVELVRGA